MNKERDDLKKELKKKEHDFKETKEHAHKTLKREKAKISREEEERLTQEDKKLKKELKGLQGKRKSILDKIESRFEKVTKVFDKKAENTVADKEKEHRKIHKEAARAHHMVEEMTTQEIEHAKKDLIKTKKRVYSRREKVFNTLQFLLVIYMFILSIVIIKDVALALGAGTIETIASTVDSNASAFGAGWFTSILAQSGSVIAILANSLVGAQIFNFETGFYILLGISLGNTITPVIASLVIKTKHHWRLRHGFELGLANVVYSFFLVILVLIIQIPTQFFTKSGDKIAEWAEALPAFQSVPDLLSVITDPLLNLVRFEVWPIAVSLLAGLAILIFSLGKVGRSMFVFLGGKRHTRAIMEKYLSNHWKAFGIGLGLTIIIPSASLLTTLLVPLAIARIIKLRQAIPYMIGTSVGTFIDVLMASFANAEGYAVAGGAVLTMMSALGILFIFGNYGSELIYRVTRYLSLRVIKMRKRNILKYIAGFALAPVLIMIIF